MISFPRLQSEETQSSDTYKDDKIGDEHPNLDKLAAAIHLWAKPHHSETEKQINDNLLLKVDFSIRNRIIFKQGYRNKVRVQQGIAYSSTMVLSYSVTKTYVILHYVPFLLLKHNIYFLAKLVLSYGELVCSIFTIRSNNK